MVRISRQGGTGRRLGRLLGSISLIGVMVTVPVGFQAHGLTGKPAAAAIAEDDIFSDLTPLTHGELAKERGGFRVSGMDINIGVQVETVVDGFVKVSTNFSIGDTGKITHLGTEVKTYMPSGDYMPDTKSIVDKAMPDVGAIVDSVFAAADAGKKDHDNVDEKAIAGGATAAAVLGTADTLVKVTNAFTPEAPEGDKTTPGSGLVDGDGISKGTGAFASGLASASKGSGKSGAVPAAPGSGSSAAPKLPLNASLFDDGALAGSNQSAKAGDLSKNAAITKTSPKATASATVAGPATVATSSQTALPQVATQVEIGGHSSPSVTTLDGKSIEVADLGGSSGNAGGGTSILHQIGDGQLSLVENSMNNITVRQSTRINLTVENFIKNHDMIRLQKSLENTARLAGVAGLRR